MAFKGTYQFVEVDVWKDQVVYIAALDEKRAANPKTKIGVIVDFANGIDRVLVIGDDAYRMGKMPRGGSETPPHEFYDREGYGAYDIEKKPAGSADMLMELLNLKEK